MLPATPALHHKSDRRAILRRTSQPPFDSFEVDYSQPDLRIDLILADRDVFTGIWTSTLWIDGQSLGVQGSWEEVLWHSDEDVDYLELELPLEGGWKLQRQMLLARNDQFLFLADALLGEEALSPDQTAEIHYQARLPLAEGIRFEGSSDSHDGLLLHRNKKLARAFPLAMPEWRNEHFAGELAVDDHQPPASLAIRQAARGRNMFVPLVLDLAPTRFRRAFTWRRLTVAESLKIAPRDQAVGYRVQVGKEQWLFYRSLAWKGNRTVLGQNYSTEFVACRFLPSGLTEDLLSIE